ncbi:MAG: sigma 54-interacting transcriptional regulator [Kofleriaceae bacterium]
MTFVESETNPLPRAEGRGATDDPVVALRCAASGVELALPLGARRWILGSRGGADLELADPYVSGLHCVLERTGARAPLTVRDRGSRNGTFIDGIPVEHAPLRPGALLTVGRTVLVAVTARSRGRRTAYEQLRGADPALVAARDQAVRVAQTDCSVLIVGETGTGKELLARLIHERSRRQAQPMVAVNCGAIPHELIGSELFGHERGAFTGAATERDGFFVEADGGTLLLDELGELPRELQPHLLRALETRRIRRLGGASERAVDVRVVAATNQLDGLGTEASPLRLDLYHRVATVVLTLPPLRERKGDLPELVAELMAAHAPQFGTKVVGDAAWDTLYGYAAGGNVRELAHAVARAMAFGGAVLGPDDFLPPGQRLAATRRAARARPRRRRRAGRTRGLPPAPRRARPAAVRAPGARRHGRRAPALSVDPRRRGVSRHAEVDLRRQGPGLGHPA